MGPEIPRRFVTAASRASLGGRFGLPHDPFSQDWEWEVADPSRFAEFLDAYTSGTLDEDERFALMEILIQSVEEMDVLDVATTPEWRAVASLLHASPELHASTIRYWSLSDNDECFEEGFRVTGPMREVRHRIEWGETG